jgi:hypothetical protein
LILHRRSYVPPLDLSPARGCQQTHTPRQRQYEKKKAPGPGGFTANPPIRSATARHPLAGTTPAGIRIPARIQRGVAGLPLPHEAGGFGRIFSGKGGRFSVNPPCDHRVPRPIWRSPVVGCPFTTIPTDVVTLCIDVSPIRKTALPFRC